MARAAVDKPRFNFGAGLVTDASGLTFPENSVRDLDNVDLQIDGSARRRLGFGSEPEGEVLTPTLTYATADGRNIAFTAHFWPNPAGLVGVNFMVFQVGHHLVIRNADAESVSALNPVLPYISALDADDTIPVDARWDGATPLEVATGRLQSTVGSGRLWFTGPDVTPFCLELDLATGFVNLRGIGAASPFDSFAYIYIRDFAGIDDGVAVDAHPTTLTETHLYNLYNAGWYDAQIDAYRSDAPENDYPSKAQQWIIGKNSTDDFEPDLLKKQDFGNSPAPTGRAKIHALLGERAGIFATDAVLQAPPHNMPPLIMSTSTYDEPAVHSGSFRTCTFHAGRIWLAGDTNPKRTGGVYFSKTIQNYTDSGVFHQVNDPTSEHFSDLVDTDGGVIYINEAGQINKLLAYNEGVLVFAENGIWFIRGGDSGFTATQFSVDKISGVTTTSPESVVICDTVVLFWAQNGVFAIDFSTGIPTVLPISEPIQRFMTAIPAAAKQYVRGCYDGELKRAVWVYLDQATYNYPYEQSFANRALMFDLRLKAFYPYSFSTLSAPEGFFSIAVPFPMRKPILNARTEHYVYVGGDLVVDSNGDPVTAFSPSTAVDGGVTITLKWYALIGAALGGTTALLPTVLELNREDFSDRGVEDAFAYITTGDDHMGDVQRFKQTTYLHSFFRRTEQKFEQQVDDTIGFDYPSGCFVRMLWDWHRDDEGHRWSASQQAYRLLAPYVEGVHDDPLLIGASIVYTKLKVRGKGRALALRYESEPLKDFRLLGFSTANTANAT